MRPRHGKASGRRGGGMPIVRLCATTAAGDDEPDGKDAQ
jgi:hypothetical protein